MKKYEIVEGRVKALRNFDNVKKGDIGGYVDGEHNLSHEGNCWISSVDAEVSDNARIEGNAKILDYARVSGNAVVSGHAEVTGRARLLGDAKVSGNVVMNKR